MSASAGYVGGGGQFMRVRDNVGGYSAEANRQNKVEADRLAKKQADSLRRELLRADEEAKRRALKEADARKYFRQYHNNPASTAIHEYCKARFGYQYSTDDVRQAMAELQSTELLRKFMPEKYSAIEHAKVEAMTLDHVTRCEKCGLITNRGHLCQCFQVGKQYGTLTVQQINGDSCTARCSCGREGQATRRDLEEGITVCMVCEEKEKE